MFAEVEWLFWGRLCGYGTRIWWALGWMLLANLGFTLIYWLSASVNRQRHPGTTQEFNFRLRLLDLPKHYTHAQSWPYHPAIISLIVKVGTMSTGTSSSCLRARSISGETAP